MEYTELFKPIKLGTLEVKNRIGGACTTTGGADINGYITENAISTYAARAAGGAGFVCIECTFASDWGAETTSFGNPRISNRSYYAGMSELAETINALAQKHLYRSLQDLAARVQVSFQVNSARHLLQFHVKSVTILIHG